MKVTRRRHYEPGEDSKNAVGPGWVLPAAAVNDAVHIFPVGERTWNAVHRRGGVADEIRSFSTLDAATDWASSLGGSAIFVDRNGDRQFTRFTE